MLEIENWLLKPQIIDTKLHLYEKKVSISAHCASQNLILERAVSARPIPAGRFWHAPKQGTLFHCDK